MANKGKALVLTAEDNSRIDGRVWLPGKETPSTVVFIVHGMAEHIDRYESFAGYLTESGMAVFGMNLRGHGPNAEQPGWFGANKGWKDILSDLDILRKEGSSRYPGIPQIILGHSMGSFLVRDYMTLKQENPPIGVILSGSADIDPLSAGLMRFLAGMAKLFKGDRHPTKLLHRIAFEANNNPYRKQAVTGVEWLCRDPGNNARYAADPLCGFVCSAAFYQELGRGFSRIGSRKAFVSWQKEIPLLITAGSRDPIGSCGKGPRSLDLRYRKAGVSDVTLYLVEDGRHEILNETDKIDTWNFIRDWIVGIL